MSEALNLNDVIAYAWQHICSWKQHICSWKLSEVAPSNKTVVAVMANLLYVNAMLPYVFNKLRDV